MSEELQPVSEAQALADLSSGIALLLEEARRRAARSVNAIMTATYWEIGRRIVEFEPGGQGRADYGEQIIERLSKDLTARFGRGFGRSNLFQMRAFYRAYAQIVQTVSGQFDLSEVATAFPLSWSHYVRLLSLRDEYARRFYETEALRGGWSLRQLDRQINSLFYERTALSRNKAAMLTQGTKAKSEDAMTPEEEIKSPYVLEFLGLKDEYSEAQLEEALIRHLEGFLLELGNDFTFVARQKRIRAGDDWYRMDLLFYHRRLRCLVIIDLKIGRLDHADVGQMNLYINYAYDHLTLPDENPPVGLILCSEPNAAVAQYAMNRLMNTVLAAEYRTVLPDPAQLEAELAETRRMLESPNRKRNPDA
ncbi:MAG TPA: PDDEXK nuclease domain-containing protein [Chthonomonadaceae bacterium]|nr:PDDEXK nuclease domain-containing protein [Chthonomonadaceae bacterium]